jgi:hypothetical protein
MALSSDDGPSSNPPQSMDKTGPVARSTSPSRSAAQKLKDLFKNKGRSRKPSSSEPTKAKYHFGNVHNMPALDPKDVLSVMISSPEHQAKVAADAQRQKRSPDIGLSRISLDDLESDETQQLQQGMSPSTGDMRSHFDNETSIAPNIPLDRSTRSPFTTTTTPTAYQNIGSNRFDVTNTNALRASGLGQTSGPQHIRHQPGPRGRMMSEPSKSGRKDTVHDDAKYFGAYGTSLPDENSLQNLRQSDSELFEGSSQVLDLSTLKTQSEIARAATGSNNSTSVAEWGIYLQQYSEVRTVPLTSDGKRLSWRSRVDIAS